MAGSRETGKVRDPEIGSCRKPDFAGDSRMLAISPPLASCDKPTQGIKACLG